MTVTPFLKPNSDEVLIALIIDKSGSMQEKRGEVVEGINAFIARQKEVPGKATLTLTYFDTVVSTPVVDAPLAQFNVLDNSNYVPGGGTALNDALGNTINALKARAAGRKVLIVVVTDGEENSSRTWSTSAVKALVETQQGLGWDFTFIGAGPNAWAQASSLGAKQFDFAGYDATRQWGTVAALASASLSVSNSRSFGNKMHTDYRAETQTDGESLLKPENKTP